MSVSTDELVGTLVEPPIMLPQMVPSAACLRCEVCCRFPDPDSHLRPYFTGDEIAGAVAGGAAETAFPDPLGSQVQLIPNPQGEGFLCPMFDVTTSHCRIYDRRPLDCQLYPLAMMWNEAHNEVLLGWDRKCPFMAEQVPPDIQRHADRMLSLLAQPGSYEQVARHPRLIGRFQEDVVVLASLPKITAAVSARWGSTGLHQFTIDDVPRMTAALERSGLCGSESLAAYHPANHYIWNGLLAYWWSELQEAFCLFAQSPDGWFMPLPPLGSGSIEKPLAEVCALMRRWNGGSPVSRVENVCPALVPQFQQLGYRLTEKEPDYLYQAAELTTLAGDRYKSQRALCNRVARERNVVIEPYRETDRPACRTLFRQWMNQKRMEGLEGFGSLLLADAEWAHEVIWAQAAALDVIGRVARIDGTVRAYTFGYWLGRSTFCVLVEVADRTFPGLAQYLFRDTCRTAAAQGAALINTMDDAGLPGLRTSKQAYHPARLLPNAVARIEQV